MTTATCHARWMRRLLSPLVAAAVAIRPTGAMATAAGRGPPVAKRVPYTVRFGVVEGENRGVEPMDPPLETK